MSTTRHRTSARRAALCSLTAAILLCAGSGMAYDKPPIPESKGNYGWSEKQRIRFMNTPLIKLAHEAIAAEDYQAAEEHLQGIIKNDPKNNHAKVFLVEVHDSTGNYQKGIEVADSLLADYSGYLDMYAYKGYMHLKLGQRPQAKTAFETLLDRSSRKYKLRNDVEKNLAELYFLDGELDKAKALGERLLEAEDNLHIRLFLGEIATQQENWPDAATHLSAALPHSTSGPEQADIRLKLGYALFNDGRFAEAEPVLARARTALTGEENLKNLTLLQAQTAFKVEKYEDAANFFEDGLDYGFSEDAALGLLNALSEADQFVKGEGKAAEFLGQKGTSPDFEEQVLLQQLFFQKNQDKYLEAYTTAQRLIKQFGKPEYLLEAADNAEKIGQLDEAARLLDEYLTDNFNTDAAMALHFVRKKQAEKLSDPAAKAAVLAASIPTLEKVLAQDGLDKELREAAQYELAQVHRATGDMDQYFTLMRDVMGDAPEADFAYEYAVQLYGDRRYDEAIDMFAISLKDDRNTERNYSVCKILADIYLLRDDLDQAVHWLEEAKQYGNTKNDRIWQLYMARVEYRQEKYQKVIRRLIPIAEEESVFHMYIGFSFYQLGMPGLALLHLNEVQDMNTLNADEKQSLYANRTYLNFDQDQDDQAISDADQSLTYKETDDMKLIRLKVLLRSGEFTEAGKYGMQLIQEDPNNELREEILTMLDEHPNPEFREEMLEDLKNIGNTAYEAELYELVGLAQFRNDQADDAVASFTRTLELDDTRTSAYYLRGLSWFRAGEFKKAEADFLILYDQAETFPATLWGDLGILQGDLEDYDLGTAALDRSTSFYPYDIDSYEELGYQYLKDRKNKEAKVAFKQATDLYAEILPYLDDEGFYEYQDDSKAMKAEFTKLDRIWGAQVYLQRTDFQFEDENFVSSVDSINGALVSQAGVGISYRPPNLGFRNEKEFDITARVIANLEPETFTPDEDTFQGGVGIMYKPFRHHNYRVSIEKLFKIGKNSEDNWLWRNSYAWEQGEKPQKYESIWLQNKIYGEISYYLEDVKRWVYYINPRIGYSYLVNSDRVTFTFPELVGVARYQSNDPSGVGTYYYGGVGANLRVLSREKDYSVNRWYLDFYAQYVWGRFDKKPEDFDRTDFDGVIIGFNYTK